MDYSHLGKKRNRRRQNPHTTRIRNKASLLVLRITLSLVLIAGFALLGGGIGLYFGILSNAPEINMTMMQAEYRSSFIVDANTGEVLHTLHAGHNHESVYIEQIPLHVQHAFVAIEDERFFEHNGIDIRGIGRAATTIIETRGARTEGASTITQQLIKNMLGNFESDFIFKLQEQYLAINFERQLAEMHGPERAKEIILESYLNIINLGRSNYGVQAAAQFYYGVDVWDLTIAQAATIAAITQNPTRFPPDRHPAANWVRAQHVLDSMLRLEFITAEEHAEAMEEMELEDGTMIGLVYSTIVLDEAGDARSIISPFDCFTNALIDSVRDDLRAQFNLTRDQANRWIFGGGLRIYTTQNQEMQAIVDRVFLDDSYWDTSDFSIEVEFNFTLYNPTTNQYRPVRRTRNVLTMEEAEAWMEEVLRNEMSAQDVVAHQMPLFTPQPQAAFVLLDHHTGHVLAMRGVRGESGANRTLNRATQSTRSPGSQLKPIGVFGPAFDMGIMHPGTIINDQPFTYIDPWNGTPWTPNNWWGSSFRGPSTVRRAIYDSYNV
ncbi:MAG: penicillin-binding protein, partial [Defluviitaleaceae bacterium]|nr:penicillin-binding protein [Defluviitaleaceae bacterium]